MSPKTPGFCIVKLTQMREQIHMTVQHEFCCTYKKVIQSSVSVDMVQMSYLLRSLVEHLALR